ENLSQKYPDILSRIASFSAKDADGNPKAKSFVLDCEAVAWDRQAGKILPFQVLSTRKRKNTTDEEIAVQVCVFAFDLLYLNGEALTRKTLRERRALLYEHFEAQDGRFAFAVHSEGSNVNDIQEFLDASIVDACEGLMVKTLDRDASYEPSRRSRNWLKVKKDYLSGVGDSLDLVVIGGYIGKGKRTGWYGGYLLACYDEESEAYQAICKVGTGFSEENLKLFSETLQSHIISGPRSYYEWTDHPLVRPDVWFEPKLVFEIKAADLSLSPVHKAAYGHIDSEKGISLRFPRFLRLRDDKAPEQATNATQVADLFRAQNRHGDDKDKD
ncbi:DNA ligase like protein, partial [Caulochytrium protostelioides]